MQKLILMSTYWLGVLCLALALLARAVNILGPDSLHFITKGNSVGYHSFLDGAVLFFLAAIASATYSSSKS